jgi:hypothetical protein
MLDQLLTIANKARDVVPDILIEETSITRNMCEIVIDYQGYLHRIEFGVSDLRLHSDEWLLDDLTTQFEKFKAAIDQLAQGKASP